VVRHSLFLFLSYFHSFSFVHFSFFFSFFLSLILSFFFIIIIIIIIIFLFVFFFSSSLFCLFSFFPHMFLTGRWRSDLATSGVGFDQEGCPNGNPYAHTACGLTNFGSGNMLALEYTGLFKIEYAAPSYEFLVFNYF
jgi:hypothetical protein